MTFDVFGLTVSSSWGNGRATFWRGLARTLAQRQHRFVFFERDVPHYARHRDLTLERARAGEDVGYIGPRSLGDFHLVLSFTRGAALGELARIRRAARPAAPRNVSKTEIPSRRRRELRSPGDGARHADERSLPGGPGARRAPAGSAARPRARSGTRPHRGLRPCAAPTSPDFCARMTTRYAG